MGFSSAVGHSGGGLLWVSDTDVNGLSLHAGLDG